MTINEQTSLLGITRKQLEVLKFQHQYGLLPDGHEDLCCYLQAQISIQRANERRELMRLFADIEERTRKTGALEVFYSEVKATLEEY